MSGGHTAAKPPAFSLALSIPGQRRFRGTVSELSVRVAEYLGYVGEEAQEVGRAVDRVVAGILDHVFDEKAGRTIDIFFSTRDKAMEIHLSYRADDVEDVPASGLERALERQQDGSSALQSMRREVDLVEFGREDGADFCRLTRRLPPSAR